MYLLDTNVWLEALLKQERGAEAEQFLKQVDPALIAVTEFSIYSIGVITLRLKKIELFESFYRDIVQNPQIRKIRLNSEDLNLIIETHRKIGLSFDDAYQYVAAKKYGLTLVSFDSDFDRTDRGRKTPGQITK